MALSYLCYTLEHVLNVTADSVYSGQFLALSKPLDDFDLFLSLHGNVDSKMFEGT